MSTDFTLEPKLFNPLCIQISEHEPIILLPSDNVAQAYDLDKGVVLGGEHYGFVIISNNKNGEPIETIYPTQCSLYGMQHKDKELNIFENNKTLFWRFDNKGNLIEPSKFFKGRQPDANFLHAQGFTSSKDIEKVNELSYKKQLTKGIDIN